jgi:hypothetical protein
MTPKCAWFRCTSVMLVCALLAPTIAWATPKPLDPATAYARIAKRSVGDWICLKEANGITLVGRIVNIGDQSVGLQLANYPEVTPVAYADIVSLRFGMTHKQFWILTSVGLALVGVMAAVGIHEVNNNKPPALPSNPALPSYP